MNSVRRQKRLEDKRLRRRTRLAGTRAFFQRSRGGRCEAAGAPTSNSRRPGGAPANMKGIAPHSFLGNVHLDICPFQNDSAKDRLVLNSPQPFGETKSTKARHIIVQTTFYVNMFMYEKSPPFTTWQMKRLCISGGEREVDAMCGPRISLPTRGIVPEEPSPVMLRQNGGAHPGLLRPQVCREGATGIKTGRSENAHPRRPPTHPSSWMAACTWSRSCPVCHSQCIPRRCRDCVATGDSYDCMRPSAKFSHSSCVVSCGRSRTTSRGISALIPYIISFR